MIFNVNSEVQINNQGTSNENNHIETSVSERDREEQDRNVLSFPHIKANNNTILPNLTDGFTLVKGITSVGLSKMRMKSNDPFKDQTQEYSHMNIQSRGAGMSRELRSRNERSKTIADHEMHRKMVNLSGLSKHLNSRLPSIDGGPQDSYYT